MAELDSLESAEDARREGNPLALFDLAQSAIEAGNPEPRFQYLQTLALAQMGDTLRAEELYDRYALGTRSDDEDALALRGRLHKDRARDAEGETRRTQFSLASAAYLRAFEVRSGYFPAINAATTAWMAGDFGTARELAEQVLRHPALNPPETFFASASLAEALILLGRPQEAGAALKAVLAGGRVGQGERASAYRQLAWLCAGSDLSADDQHDILGPIRVPPVVNFIGHMFRADADIEAGLLAQIHAALEDLGSSVAYGALACGADILIAEEVLRRGGELHVVLPFTAADFIEASVRPGGEAWVQRFHNCLHNAASVTLATRMGYVEHEGQFAYGSRFAMGLAQLRANNLAATAIQLAVWDRHPPSGPSGTAVDVMAWRAMGLETRIIEPGAADRQLDRPRLDNAKETSSRETRAIIFADYKGFSKLSEAAVPVFTQEVMGRVAKVLNKHNEEVCCRNTWGDSLYAVISGAAEAAEIVLQIIEALKDVRLSDAMSQDQEGMRIGLHIGPVYRAVDPVTGVDNFYGSEVTLTARIEPKVIPGEIYTTQAFAAILATVAPDRFVTRYVGRVELAKGYGVLPIYQLERRIKAAG